MRRVCFLFNHDQTHQMAHSLPIALALIESGAADVTLAVTTPALADAVRRAAGPALARATLVHLAPANATSRIAVAALDWLVPARKLAIYRDHRAFFARFDALVVAEKSALLLKSRYGLDTLKIVHTRHGAGDRAIGFDAASAGFDLVLVSGPKIRDRLIADAGVDPARIAITGYAKFDLYAGRRDPLPIAADGRRIILYTPHPSPALSSWYRWGNAVLRAFAQDGRYLLVFAPHVMLLRRRFTVTIAPPAIARVPQPDSTARAAPNILIDRGSAASADMRYTNAADLYIGDASSQVYEYLVRPRPCLFLDAHGVDWRGNADFRHWTAGPVLTHIDGLMAAVDAAFASHGAYLPAQQALLDATFSVTDVPAGRRGAAAIVAMLDGG